MKCDYVGCTGSVVFVCACRRCETEPNEGKFWSCSTHKHSSELVAQHQRIYPNPANGLRLVPFYGGPPTGEAAGEAASDELSRVAQLISAECDAVKAMLVEKNRSYGNSFAEPVGIFAKDLPADAQIRVRIDDKLSRLARGGEFAGEDTALDLIGYLILFRVLKKMESKP